MKRIAILDDYQAVALSSADWSNLNGRVELTVFRERFADSDEMIRRLAPFHVLVLNRERTPLDAARMARLPNLELIVTAGMRNAAIDLAAATARSITVCGTRTLGTPTAELAWALILGFCRSLPLEAQAMAAGRWQTTVGRDLHGKTLGVAGFGRIGKLVAQVGLAFGMRVLAWSRSLTHAQATTAGIESVTRDSLLAQSDILTLHLPLNAATRGVIDAAAFALMKPGALLVNTARGALVDELSLLRALQAGQLGGAALDTFEEEPLPRDHPFLRLPNVLLTPHLGYVTHDNYRAVFHEAAEDISAWLDGHPIRVISA